MSGRPRLSPIMDRFLAGQFFGPFLVCLGAFTVAYLIGDVFDRFSDLIHYGGFGLLGLEYFLLKIPLIISQLLPVACLAGVLLGFALLNRSGEVLACQQLGISRLEMATPVLTVAIIISLFNFALSETVVPLSTRQARYLYEVQMKKREIRGVFFAQRTWVRMRDGFFSADRYDAKAQTLHGVTMYVLDAEYALRDIVHADSAHWNGHEWIPLELRQYRLDKNGTVATPDTHLALAQSIKPSDLNLVLLDPEEFSLWDLNHYIHDLRNKGLDPGGYIVDRDLKYAMPLACLIMVALGMALSLDPMPRTLSLGRSFGLAIGIGFGYWLAFGLTSSLGRAGVIPAAVAAWTPNTIFAALALSIFLFGEER
ncbi:MAG TPA: LPS export ABC transporter permease LptG [Candidatus Binataceae bacterium]|jgi:lipopolysaccharide export system permease protein|nr:LPS export ABC transporter permease LptG [Candidatus Binataceae bacterium]